MKLPLPLILIAATLGPLQAQRNLQDIPPPDPEIESASFQVADGFEVNLWASDPLIAKPTQISFDHEGRLWVASSETYPQLNVNQEPSDRILILEDRNGDGVAEKSSVYYDKLIIPGGVLPDGTGGAYVAHGEEFIHLEDTNGDGKADKKTVLLSGFGSEDTHHTLHRLRWGPGGLIYMLQGYYIGTHVETLYGPRRLNGGGLWSYDTRTRRLEIYSRGLVNPWGMTFDRWGQTFQTDGAGGEGINYSFPDAVFMASPHEHRTLRGLNPGRPKSCGIEVVSGSHFPAEWKGSLLTNDFRAHNIDRYVVAPKDSAYTSTLQADLLGSSHVSFRPIDLVMGPDGAVYVADWYSPIIQHGEVDFRDKRRDQVHGRIWRITAKGRPLVKPVDCRKASIGNLLDHLKHDADWVRLNARQELKIRDEKRVSAALESWVAKLDRAHPDFEHHRLEALWAYQTITTARSHKLLEEVMQSPDHRARAAALRVLYHWRAHPGSLARLVADPHPQVRREAVSTLGQLNSAEAFVVALGVLDHPIDKYLDFALWRTCRLLEPYWFPAFQSGTLALGENAAHIGFALKAIEKPEALATLVATLNQASEEADPALVRLIGKIGTPADLDAVLRIATSKDHPLASDAALALVEAAEDRRAFPANENDREAACKLLLAHQDPETLTAVYGLIGEWQIKSLAPELKERLAKSSTRYAPSLARGLATLGRRDFLAAISGNRQGGLPGRVSAAAALYRVDPASGARLIADLFAQPLPNAAVEELMNAVLSKAERGIALAGVLSGRKLSKGPAIHATRLIEISGKAHPELLAAFLAGGSLRPVDQDLDPKALQALLAKIKDGDSARGRKIYHREALACTVCHVVEGKGGVIGPDLSSIGTSAPADYLVESLLAPSKKIKEGYRMSLLTFKDGDVISGAIVRENQNVLVVRSAFGKESRVPRADVKSRETIAVSMMPGGLTAHLREDEFVDLLAYLASLGKTAEQKPGQTP